MSKYNYRVMMTAADEDCLGKRAVAFQSADFLDFYAAGEEAQNHITSQTCIRCGQNHEYCATDIERGEPGANGDTYYRDVYPSYKKTEQAELPYDDYSMGW